MNERFLPMRISRDFYGFMMGRDVFQRALILSLVIHLVIFTRLSSPVARNFSRALKDIEVTYDNLKLQSKARVKPEDEASKEKRQGAREIISKKTEALLGKKAANPLPIKDVSRFIDKFAAFNKQPAVLSEMPVKRKVSVPPIKSEKINNPVYQNYYEAVRSIIRKRAYANYSKLETGEVYMTFVILSDGAVKQIHLVDEKTSAGGYLQEISLRSIQESNPFPSFPQDLTYPELSFNVAISFELEE